VSHAAEDDAFGAGLPLDTAIARPRPDVVLLEVDGEVDTLTAPRLAARLDEALDTADADGSTVVADLSGVTFLASSGLAALINAARRATGSGRRLHVVAASRAVSRPMQVTGVDALFDTHTDVDSALAGLQRPTPPDVASPARGVGR
jgi:anti-sigma B factor antagonist